MALLRDQDCDPLSVQVEVDIILQLRLLRHYCRVNEYIELEPVSHQEILRFDLHDLSCRFCVRDTYVGMVRRLGIDEQRLSRCLNFLIDETIRQGLLRVQELPLANHEQRHVMRFAGEIMATFVVEHFEEEEEEEEEEEAVMGATLAESEAEFERSNYGMVPATEASIKKMVKRFRAKDGDSDSCTICLEELKAGSQASQMPCLHTFHAECIEKWLRQSHYCPICRFEMPTSQTFVYSSDLGL